MSEGDGAQYLIPTVPMMGRGLVNHDPRSWDYRATDLLTTSQRRLGVCNRMWRRGGPYDQGLDPHCVAFAGKGVFNTTPRSRARPYRVRSRFDTGAWYKGAQEHDQWPGSAYDGTSALGLCRFLAGQGLLSEYRWCFGLDDLLLTLCHVGPVMLGVWWYDRMFETDHDGFVMPHGEQVGGHEVEIVGCRVPSRGEPGFVTIMNSWGAHWGDRGRCRIRWDDLSLLLHQDGDAVVLVK